MAQIREAFGRALVKVGRENPNVVVLDADLATSTKVTYFAEEFPERFFEIGVCEQNMIGVAAGFARMGKIPFTSTFGVFASKRACDQVSMLVAYPHLNVKIVGAYSGIVSGNNGATHQAIEDVAIMRVMPGMVVVDPADEVEMTQAVKAIVEYNGPVYLRLTRDEWPVVSPPDHRFRIGKAGIVREGKDVTLIGSGMMVSQCIEAAKILTQDGIESKVMNISTIKPIDVECVVKSARETRCIVTAENHTILGGLGSAVAEVLVENEPVPLIRVGLQDTFGECGTNEELLDKYGISPKHIAKAAQEVIKKKPSTAYLKSHG
ncbi:MAG: transketolase family protein [bacterium]